MASSRLEDLEFPVIDPKEYLKDPVHAPDVTLQRVPTRKPARIERVSENSPGEGGYRTRRDSRSVRGSEYHTKYTDEFALVGVLLLLLRAMLLAVVEDPAVARLTMALRMALLWLMY